jgi:hypothetical protein
VKEWTPSLKANNGGMDDIGDLLNAVKGQDLGMLVVSIDSMA